MSEEKLISMHRVQNLRNGCGFVDVEGEFTCCFRVWMPILAGPL